MLVEAAATLVLLGAPADDPGYRFARSLALEKIDGESIIGSVYEEPLLDLGFRPGPRKLTLTT